MNANVWLEVHADRLVRASAIDEIRASGAAVVVRVRGEWREVVETGTETGRTRTEAERAAERAVVELATELARGGTGERPKLVRWAGQGWASRWLDEPDRD